MVGKSYIPEKGDFVWVNFTPQVGHEQAGKRPAIVLTESTYNSTTGMMIVCPITKHAKGYPFEVEITKGSIVFGVVLSDHVKSIDWKGRGAEFISKADNRLVLTVLSVISDLLGNDN